MNAAIFSVLVCLLTITPSFSLNNHWTGVNDQQPLQSRSISTSRNYSVGFSLASSYGAAAVIIDDAHEDQKIFTWVIYGDLGYKSVMTRLSLKSSRHVAPPYNDMEDYFDDIPRVLARRANKKIGLPATADVGILATVIKNLRAQIESDLHITVLDGTLTTTHLEALYQDDVEDICEYAGFKYIIPKDLFRPILYETSSAYAGYGLGLCKHWQNETQCDVEENEVPLIPVFAVHYSRTALTVTLAMIRSALGMWDPWHRRVERFDLGSDAKAWYASEDDYWRDVKASLLQRMLEIPAMKKPERIILTGDMIQGDFTLFLTEIIKDHMGIVPPIFSDDTVVVAARGAAELRRRGQSPFQ